MFVPTLTLYIYTLVSRVGLKFNLCKSKGTELYELLTRVIPE